MKYEIEDKLYNVDIKHKDTNKMFLRVMNDFTLSVTVPKRVKLSEVKFFLDQNKDKITTLINQRICLNNTNNINSLMTKEEVLLFGKRYKSSEITSNDKLNCLNEIKEMFIKITNEQNINDLTLKFRVMRSAWGICKPKKREITLNTRLMFLERELVEAIIYHELAHMYQCNHSKKFYDVLLKMLPDYKARYKVIKERSFVLQIPL